MKKEQFLRELSNKLKGLPRQDAEDRLSFYEEAIEDRIADGKSEDEAVAELGTVDEVVQEIAKDVPMAKLVKERLKPRRSLRVWEIVLIVLGFPLWLPLLLIGLVLCLVAYLLIWVLVIVTYTVEVSLGVASIGSLVAFIASLGGGTFEMAGLGAFMLCLGGAFLFVFACIGATKASIALSKKILGAIKASFIKKGSN